MHRLINLSDGELLAAVARLVTTSRNTTALLVAHLGEVEERRLHLARGHSSMFGYCQDELHMSEGSTYKHIHAARAARIYPALLDALAQGRIHLSAACLLAAKLTPENHVALIAAAEHKSKRAVAEMLAERFPRPDVAASLRKLADHGRPGHHAGAHDTLPLVVATPPAAAETTTHAPSVSHLAAAASQALGSGCASVQPSYTAAVPSLPATDTGSGGAAIASLGESARPSVGARFEPLSADRFKLTVTIGRGVHDKLRQARELLRHQIPDGDLEQILDRALDMLIERQKKERFALCESRRAPKSDARADDASRRIPAAVRREVADRDDLRCTFTSPEGKRCEERGMLEFHHREPFACGGESTADNLALLCRAHNAYQAELDFGRARMRAAKQAPRQAARRLQGRTESPKADTIGVELAPGPVTRWAVAKDGSSSNARCAEPAQGFPDPGSRAEDP